MQVVPITRNALVFDADDWWGLGTLMENFNKVCDSQTCQTCPLGDFCFEHENPAEYLKHLYDFLDD